METKAKYWSYHPGILDENEELFEPLLETITKNSVETPSPLSLTQPLFQFFSRPDAKDYKYFKSMIKGQPFTPELILLAKAAKDLCMALHLLDKDQDFNTAFINFYLNGDYYIPPHRDVTHGDYPIVSFTIYSKNQALNEMIEKDYRELGIKNITTNEVELIKMEHNSAIVMWPGMQEHFIHWIPKSETKTCRMNITLRIQ